MKFCKYLILSTSIGIIGLSFLVTPLPHWDSAFYIAIVIAFSCISLIIFFHVIKLSKRNKKHAVFLFFVYTFFLPIFYMQTSFYKSEGIFCSNEEPITISWDNCKVQFIIINQSCIPDGPEGGVVYIRNNELPLMQEIMREPSNFWFDKESILRGDKTVTVLGKESKYEHLLPVSCQI